MGADFKLDSISQARLGEVFPALAHKVRELAGMLALDRAVCQDGIAIRVVQGLRSWSEQQALYEQGRSRAGKIVTNCPGGYSYHNFGLAVDVVPSTHGPGQPFDPDWNSNHPVWKRMEQIGISLGLTAGAHWRTFPDAPHFQLSGKFPEHAPSDEVRRLFHAGGVQAFWEEVKKG